LCVNIDSIHKAISASF